MATVHPEDLGARLYNASRARRIAEVVGVQEPGTFKLERDYELAYDNRHYIFTWKGSDGTWHRHKLMSLTVWFNQCEPGSIEDEELKLLRMKVKLTTA